MVDDDRGKNKMNDKKLNRTATVFQLAWMAVVVVLGAGKAFYDINDGKKQDDLIREEIEVLKTSVKEEHQLNIKSDKDIAVIKSELEAVRRQNSVLLIKMDELYKMMIDKKP